MKTILSLCLMLFVLPTFAANEITIRNMPYGSGTPGQSGTTQAEEVSPGSGLYQAPGYMPGYPTSATLFPRVVDINCTQTADKIVCDVFNWYPSMGRGEYLLIRPHVVRATPPPVQPPPAVVVAPLPVKTPTISVYFDLDKSVVKPEFHDQLRAEADMLKANVTLSILIEGNTDSRDNVAYNLALGKRRAEAVKHELVSMGVSDTRITTVSYGKQFLRLPCLFERCYKENRRVDILVK